jgi:glucose-6-phosphate 1-dehydrogenase
LKILILFFRWLYRDGFLPEHIRFIGYARSQLTIEKIFENAAKYMKVGKFSIIRNFMNIT